MSNAPVFTSDTFILDEPALYPKGATFRMEVRPHEDGFIVVQFESVEGVDWNESNCFCTDTLEEAKILIEDTVSDYEKA